jgi:hypothetical protein
MKMYEMGEEIMTELCIGATSQLVAEEAAKLGVAQVIASRRQVNGNGGYTGMTQRDLVNLVHHHSGGKTAVVRDHGGPHQNGETTDDWLAELNDDVIAGFDGLHLDVSQLPVDKQVDELVRLAGLYGHSVKIQVGGERDIQEWLNVLLAATLARGVTPSHCVIAMGSRVMRDKQGGRLLTAMEAKLITKCYRELGVKSVAHNMDWVPDRSVFTGAISAINLAPEIAVTETDAWLRAMPLGDARNMLDTGYESKAWTRWFRPADGTRFERARCGLRYIWAGLLPQLQQRSWYTEAEEYVRGEVRDVITAG